MYYLVGRYIYYLVNTPNNIETIRWTSNLDSTRANRNTPDYSYDRVRTYTHYPVEIIWIAYNPPLKSLAISDPSILTIDKIMLLVTLQMLITSVIVADIPIKHLPT